eukprot:57075-Chlamydomonas_euryale.AAC.1
MTEKKGAVGPKQGDYFGAVGCAAGTRARRVASAWHARGARRVANAPPSEPHEDYTEKMVA